jgi:hypothetical protein
MNPPLVLRGGYGTPTVPTAHRLGVAVSERDGG